MEVIVIKNEKNEEGDWVNSNEKNFDVSSNDISRFVCKLISVGFFFFSFFLVDFE